MKNAPAIEVLKGITGLTSVEKLENGAFRAHFSDSQEAMEQIVEQSAANQWHLTEMRLEKVLSIRFLPSYLKKHGDNSCSSKSI